MFIFKNLYAMLETQFGALTPLMLIGAVGLILIMSVLPFLLVKQSEPFDKVKTQRIGGDEREVRVANSSAALRRDEKVDKLQKFANFLEPQNSGEMNDARLQMVRAGYRSKNAVRILNFMQLLSGILGFILGGAYVFIASISDEIPIQNMIIYILLGGIIGFYTPKIILLKEIQKRKAEIINGFPDALDLMLVSVEAGQSLDQSIIRIAKETRLSCPALSDELEIVSQEVKAGKERVLVLKDMSQRVDVPDITSFVSTLVQSTTFGTSIAEALRMYSAEMRDKRAARAEEAANKIPVMLTIATMIFTLPPMFTILIGPTMYKFSFM
jgi:tight adherence protein C